MGIRELLALFMVTGVVSVGVIFPLYKYARNKYFLLGCLLFMALYTFLAVKTSAPRPDATSLETVFSVSSSVLNYLSTTLCATLYLLLSVGSSVIYDKIRKTYHLTSTWWLGIVLGILLAASLYAFVTAVCSAYIYFNTCVILFAMIAIAVVMRIIPWLMIFILQKRTQS